MTTTQPRRLQPPQHRRPRLRPGPVVQHRRGGDPARGGLVRPRPGASVAVAALWLRDWPRLLVQPAGVADHAEVRRALGDGRAAAASAVALAAAAVSPLLPAGLWLLAAAMLVVGMAASVFSLARQKYLTEAVPVILRARALRRWVA